MDIAMELRDCDAVFNSDKASVFELISVLLHYYKNNDS